MITLRNGLSFSCIAASGARGWSGNDEGHGYARAWKWPFSWCWPDIPVVAKTVTAHPREGNYNPWMPWRCVRLVRGGLVNAVGLSNPGIEAWVRDWWPRAANRGVPVFASIMPVDDGEAYWMASVLADHCAGLAGVEINLSCPNVEHRFTDATTVISRIVREVKLVTKLPVIVKLAWQDDFIGICKALEEQPEHHCADAFHLINTVPWATAKDGLSPLAHLGGGGVSGWPLDHFSLLALSMAKANFIQTPIISGGGIMSAAQAVHRLTLGAGAVSLGSVYLLRPWRVNGIIKAVESYEQEHRHG
jgi:dihydroorotate dehydrogenase (NAD+) catalytic subunit